MFMYKKALSLLLTGNLIVMTGFLCAGAISGARLAAQPVSQLALALEEVEEKARRQETARTATAQQHISIGMGIADAAVSGQRIVDYELMERSGLYLLEKEDREALLRIVEAEAGSEDEDGRLLVANVVLNRVNSESFPETVSEVVFQRERGVTQFSPVSNGRYYTVEVSEATVRAVERALSGEDLSEGALYFASRKYADSDKMKWFDEHLTFLFSHGGHEFFK
ncbi:MAG: cell wall hydrolase [bacterium]|nr:cell wall hydrolase [bacterium]